MESKSTLDSKNIVFFSHMLSAPMKRTTAIHLLFQILFLAIYFLSEDMGLRTKTAALADSIIVQLGQPHLHLVPRVRKASMWNEEIWIGWIAEWRSAYLHSKWSNPVWKDILKSNRLIKCCGWSTSIKFYWKVIKHFCYNNFVLICFWHKTRLQVSIKKFDLIHYSL